MAAIRTIQHQHITTICLCVDVAFVQLGAFCMQLHTHKEMLNCPVSAASHRRWVHRFKQSIASKSINPNENYSPSDSLKPILRMHSPPSGCNWKIGRWNDEWIFDSMNLADANWLAYINRPAERCAAKRENISFYVLFTFVHSIVHCYVHLTCEKRSRFLFLLVGHRFEQVFGCCCTQILELTRWKQISGIAVVNEVASDSLCVCAPNVLLHHMHCTSICVLDGADVYFVGHCIERFTPMMPAISLFWMWNLGRKRWIVGEFDFCSWRFIMFQM